MDHLNNKWMIVAFILGFLLQIAVTEIPILIHAFGTVHLALREWIRLVVLAAFPLLAHELMILCSFDFETKSGKKKRMKEEAEQGI